MLLRAVGLPSRKLVCKMAGSCCKCVTTAKPSADYLWICCTASRQHLRSGLALIKGFDRVLLLCLLHGLAESLKGVCTPGWCNPKHSLVICGIHLQQLDYYRESQPGLRPFVTRFGAGIAWSRRSTAQHPWKGMLLTWHALVPVKPPGSDLQAACRHHATQPGPQAHSQDPLCYVICGVSGSGKRYAHSATPACLPGLELLSFVSKYSFARLWDRSCQGPGLLDSCNALVLSCLLQWQHRQATVLQSLTCWHLQHGGRAPGKAAALPLL